MAPIPNSEPTLLYAGDTVRWQRFIVGYPASEGWVLTYILLNASAKIVLSSTANGDKHDIYADAASTAEWAAGRYAWRAQVSKDGDAFTIGEGRLTIIPNFEASATLDTRSFARKALEAVEAYLANPSHLTAAEYQIAGRSLKRHTLPELMVHRDRLKAEVAREDAATRLSAGLPDRRRVFVRFGA